MFDPNLPYNDLPTLPPAAEIETTATLKAAISANRALAELKGRGELIPDQSVLVHAVTLQEARLSSEIEQIVTTTDRLYQALADTSDDHDPHTKEVLQYREALWHGVTRMREGRPLSTVLFEELVGIIRQNNEGVRRMPGTALGDPTTGAIVYTPPEGETVVREKLANLERFIHAEDGIDPLIRLAVIHYQFEAVHPFSDGNGRTGRIINVLYLLQQRLLSSPVLFLSRHLIEHKSDYYRLLREVTEQGAWEAWILFMLDAVRQTSAATIRQVEAIRELMDDFAARLREDTPKAYSKELVELLFERPYCKIAFLVDRHIAKRQTASRYLQEIADKGLLSARKTGRETVYINAGFLRLLSTPHVDEIDTTG